MAYTDEQLFKAFGRLPEDVQDVFADPNLGPLIHTIAIDHGVDPAGSLDIEDEVAHVLLGLAYPEELAVNIRRKLGIPEEKARKIASEIQIKIFKNVMKSLHDMHKSKKSTAGTTHIEAGKGETATTPAPEAQKPPEEKTSTDVPQSIQTPLPTLEKEAGKVTPQHIFEKKLEGVFKTSPAVVTKVGEQTTPSTLKQQALEGRPKHVDPYREAVE
ncbi:MAG: hypothetical protein BMS9Abin13_581 [Patescibacteria group bacterium]|nr:MAG: hypothetical protein BMS9Abin13_581 [Patescibacteria group bacterium]